MQRFQQFCRTMEKNSFLLVESSLLVMLSVTCACQAEAPISADATSTSKTSTKGAPFAGENESLTEKGSWRWCNPIHSVVKTGPYVYVEIQKPDFMPEDPQEKMDFQKNLENQNTVWIATMPIGLSSSLGETNKIGEIACVKTFALRRDFYSARLQKTFTKLFFGLVEVNK